MDVKKVKIEDSIIDDSVMEGLDSKEELKIKTVLFKESDSEEEATRRKNIMGKAKIVAGAAILLTGTLAAVLLNSKKRR